MKLICIPAYNEEKNITTIVKDCKKFVTRINDQALIETLGTYLDEQSADPLYKKVTTAGKTITFKENEGLRLEFKAELEESEI